MPEEQGIAMTPDVLATLVQEFGGTIPEGANLFEAHAKASGELEAIAKAEQKANVVDLNDPDQLAKFLDVVMKHAQAQTPKAPALFDGADKYFDGPVTLEKVLQTPLQHAPDKELFKEVQDTSDLLLLQRQVMAKEGLPPAFQSMKSWQQAFGTDGRLRKAMDTATATEGSEWIPTAFSAQVIESVYLEANIASVFEHVPMPTSPYKVPMLTGDFTYYLMPEALEDEAVSIPASGVTSGAATLTAKQVAARSLYSTELQEDAAFDMAARLREKLPAGLARALDEMIVDGDTTATHQDSDVTNPLDRRKGWRGLRIQGMTLTGCNADWTSWAAATASPLFIAAVKAMGVYGADPAQTVVISGPSGCAGIMLDTAVQTVEKFGPGAAVAQGAVPTYYGRRVLNHGQMRENLNASGVYDGVTMTKTLILLASTRGLVIGDRRNITVSSQFLQAKGQNEMVITWRGAATFPYGVAAGSGKVVYNGYNITS